MTTTLLGLSRTCNLRDFPGCETVAGWQQTLAHVAWAIWIDNYHLRTREESLVHNWSGCDFEAPGPSAIYRYRGQDDAGVEKVSAVFGLCVLDHTDAPVRFLTRSAQLLRPHGLLYLTFAFWNAQGPDVAKGSQDRARIYNAGSWKKLMREARHAGFETFGGVDWAYHGHKLDDHSLASLVLTRR